MSKERLSAWAEEELRTNAEVNPSSQTIAKPNVICRACFKGEMTKEHFYILLKYIDDMKLRGWEFEKHERNGKNETLNIDYVLVKYGI